MGMFWGAFLGAISGFFSLGILAIITNGGGRNGK